MDVQMFLCLFVWFLFSHHDSYWTSCLSHYRCSSLFLSVSFLSRQIPARCPPPYQFRFYLRFSHFFHLNGIFFSTVAFCWLSSTLKILHSIPCSLIWSSSHKYDNLSFLDISRLNWIIRCLLIAKDRCWWVLCVALWDQNIIDHRLQNKVFVDEPLCLHRWFPMNSQGPWLESWSTTRLKIFSPGSDICLSAG